LAFGTYNYQNAKKGAFGKAKMGQCIAIDIASGIPTEGFDGLCGLGWLLAPGALNSALEEGAEGPPQTAAWRASQIPFDSIVSRYTSMVYSIAFHFLRDSGLAEDVAQEAFLKLFGNLGGIKSETHLALWLRRVTVRLCIDENRKFAKRFVQLDSVPEPTIESDGGDFLAEGRVRAVVGELPPQSRMALILRFQEGLSPSEIAEVLKKPVNTVKSCLHRALVTLRDKLAPMFDNEKGEGRYGQDL
jgi:RNA polymerase sigma-70 factor (ECF subfamily)